MWPFRQILPCIINCLSCPECFSLFPPSPSWLKERGRDCWWCAILLSPGCGWRTSVCTILPGHQVAWRTRYSIELGLPCLASHQGHCLVDTGDSSIPTNIPILGMCTFQVVLQQTSFSFYYLVANNKMFPFVRKYCRIDCHTCSWGEKNLLALIHHLTAAFIISSSVVLIFICVQSEMVGFLISYFSSVCYYNWIVNINYTSKMLFYFQIKSFKNL